MSITILWLNCGTDFDKFRYFFIYLPEGKDDQNPRRRSGHHTHCECIKCNNAAWCPTLRRPIEILLHHRASGRALNNETRHDRVVGVALPFKSSVVFYRDKSCQDSLNSDKYFLGDELVRSKLYVRVFQRCQALFQWKSQLFTLRIEPSFNPSRARDFLSQLSTVEVSDPKLHYNIQLFFLYNYRFVCRKYPRSNM